MNFEEAMKEIKKGKKVRRKSEPTHIYRKKGDMIVCSCGKDTMWKFSYFKAKDYEIVK